MALVVMTMFLFLFITLTGWAEHSSMEVIGAVGGVVYLIPSTQTNTSIHQVHWRRNDMVKIAIRYSNGDIQYPNSFYKDRLTLFPNNTLRISRLRKNDSSKYQIYLEDEMGKDKKENIQLTVFDLVPKPTVRAKVIKNDLMRCEAILDCSVGLEGVTYKWVSSRKLSLVGETMLHFSFNPSVETYTCIASNIVSSNNASLIYRHPCYWTVESSAAMSCSSITVLLTLGHLLLFNPA